MATRTITGRIYKPDGTAWASGAVTAELMTRIAVGSGYVVGQYDEATTTDANGDFTLALETPAADAWQYRITLPDDNRITFNLEAGAALTILDIVNDLNLDATVSAATLTALIAAKADRPVGHTVGNLATLDTEGDPADSGIAPAAIGDAVSIQGVTVNAAAPGDGEALIYSSGAGEYAPGAVGGAYLPLAGGTLTGALLLPAGTVGAPALALAADTDTGIYQPSAGKLAIVTNGADAVTISPSGDRVSVTMATGDRAYHAYYPSTGTNTTDWLRFQNDNGVVLSFDRFSNMNIKNSSAGIGAIYSYASITYDRGGEVYITLTSGGGYFNLRHVTPSGYATHAMRYNASGIAFLDATPIARQTVSGSRAGNAALASLLTALAAFGLITDSTS